MIFPCLWLQVPDCVFLAGCVSVCRAVPACVAFGLSSHQFPCPVWQFPDAILHWTVPVSSFSRCRRQVQVQLVLCLGLHIENGDTVLRRVAAMLEHVGKDNCPTYIINTYKLSPAFQQQQTCRRQSASRRAPCNPLF